MRTASHWNILMGGERNCLPIEFHFTEKLDTLIGNRLSKEDSGGINIAFSWNKKTNILPSGMTGKIPTRRTEKRISGREALNCKTSERERGRGHV